MDSMSQGGANVCKCSHHKMWSTLLIVFGLLFLGGNFGWWGMQVVNTGWPILVILAGFLKIMEGKCKCC